MYNSKLWTCVVQESWPGMSFHNFNLFCNVFDNLWICLNFSNIDMVGWLSVGQESWPGMCGEQWWSGRLVKEKRWAAIIETRQFYLRVAKKAILVGFYIAGDLDRSGSVVRQRQRASSWLAFPHCSRLWRPGLSKCWDAFPLIYGAHFCGWGEIWSS